MRKILLVFMILPCLAKMGLWAAGPRTLASTAWTAAFCRAAGITDVTVLASVYLLHPPDYELKPSDIPVLMEAELIVAGGYEAMMERLHTHASSSGARLVQIETSYDPAIMTKSVETLAAVAGTVPAGLEAVKLAWQEARRQIVMAGLGGARVIVHSFYVPFAQEMGFEVQGVFGPMPPGPRSIAELAEIPAMIIIDNGHNPAADSLREVHKDSVFVELINFPGQDGTVELADVIAYNAGVLIKGASKKEM
ncbi:MAG: hypothetical protein B0D92_05320 [Spirochaeta sp. LUC14_002_19_P3]|nr:MAG: hypothetical protein B0D92_05320 [Spirochaeta sp. LUC14_002_19_P3]